MACSVTIASVTGIGPVAGVPTAIRVAGTATDCPTVNLSIHCPGFTTGQVFTGSATVVGGLWTVDVPAPAFAALLAWKSRCNETWCALAKEVTYVIGGMILPLVGFIALVPGLMACANGAASAVVGAIFGPIAVYAAAC